MQNGDWLKPQGRFKHLFKPADEDMLVKFQEYVDASWNSIVKMHNESHPDNQIDPDEGKTW